jgi:hypothetical protein
MYDDGTMHGLPKTVDLTFLIGKTVEQVASDSIRPEFIWMVPQFPSSASTLS